MTDKFKARIADVASYTSPGWDVRIMRLFIVGALVLTAVWTLRHLLTVELFEKNKLEVGLLLGWLIAKSGTVIDWLFGGSESGARRNDMNAHQASRAPPIEEVLPQDAVTAARQTADAAEKRADRIEADAAPLG